MATMEQVNQMLEELNKRRKRAKVIDYLEVPRSECRNCKYRKELYGGNPPQECLECGFLNQRNAPYFSKLPVYEDLEQCEQGREPK